jgi:hypothetical protein
VSRIAAHVVIAAMTATVFAGCLEDASARDYHAAATDGKFALGWAYDGAGVLPFDGFIMIHAVDRDNTGEAYAAGMLNGKRWVIVFDEFAQQGDRAFQDGGIAGGLDEHGDTGVGDASIPRVRADMAAWGTARVTVDGQHLPDALTGDDRWVAHYMVILTGVRDKDGKIWNAGRTAPYDPGNASDGYSEEGDHEVHLILRSHATTPPNATSVDRSGTTGPTPTPANMPRRIDVENKYLYSTFDATLTMSGNLAPNTFLRFDFRDPDGQTARPAVTITQPLTGQPAPVPVTFDMTKVGTYRIDVSGNALNTNYAVRGTIQPPSNVLMNFWWENVIFGAAAEQFEGTQDNHTDGHAHSQMRHLA